MVFAKIIELKIKSTLLGIMNRRDFLRVIIKSFFSVLMLVIGYIFLYYFYPSRIKEKKIYYVYLIEEDELPKRGVKKIVYQYKSGDKLINNKVFISSVNNVLTAFSPVCSHLGCFVNWDNNKKEFICPCHAGRYDINGNVISGPPPKPLTKMPLEIRDGKVYIGILM